MKIAAYMTSWGPVASLANFLLARIDTIILSFGQWDANGRVIGSDRILDVPVYDPYYMTPSTIAWTQYKHFGKSKNVTVAMGGQTYSGMWDLISTEHQRQNVAANLVKLLRTKYPVYMKNADPLKITRCMAWTWDKKCDMKVYQPVGTVSLDGLDLDFERDERILPKTCADVIALVKMLRQLLGNTKTISLTGFSVAADPVECGSPQRINNCSYIHPSGRSAHCGELLPVLKQHALFDAINVMAYDAGPRFLYKLAMANYAVAAGRNKSKIILGNTINSQWGPSPGGNFVESLLNNIARATWAKMQKYGGFFVWNIGAHTSGMPVTGQITQINKMAAGM